MKSIKYIILMFLLASLLGCRNSPRNSRPRSLYPDEVVDDEKRKQNLPEENDSENRERKKHIKDEDYSVSENDEDVNVTPKSTDRRNTYWSNDGYENIELLESSCDYNVPKTKGFANKLAGKANFSDGTFNIEQLCEIFDYCISKWRYVNDPKGSEYLAKASETIISSLTGDCDDFAILIASCMIAIGGDVCIITAYGENGGHAYAEVDVSGMNLHHVESYIKKKFTKHKISEIVIRNDGRQKWLNLDWQADYPGGPTFQASERNHYTCIDGKWAYHQ